MEAFFRQSVNILETSHAYQIPAPTNATAFDFHDTYIHTYFIKTPFNSAFQSQCHDLVNGRLMCIVLYLNIVRLVQITVCFLVTITCQTPPSMCHHTRSWCIQGAVVVAAVEAVVRYFDIFHQWARTDFKFHFCCVFFFWQKIWKSLLALFGVKCVTIKRMCRSITIF